MKPRIATPRQAENGEDTSPPEMNGSWSVQEHIAVPVQVQAEKLLDEAGTPGLAKQAVEVAAQQRMPIPASYDEFARQNGFNSYLELFEASAPIVAIDGQKWLLTAVSGGEWITWKEQDFTALRRFHSRDEAIANCG